MRVGFFCDIGGFFLTPGSSPSGLFFTQKSYQDDIPAKAGIPEL